MEQKTSAFQEIMQKIRKKLANFWFYYKWHTLGAAFVVFAITMGMVTMLNQPKYDATVVWAMRGAVSVENSERLQAQLERYCPDINGDGEVNVELQSIFFAPDEQTADADREYQNRVTLVAYMSTGDAMLYILDDALVEMLSEAEDAFVDLEQDFGQSDDVNGNRFYLKNAPVLDATLVQALPESLSIQIRHPSEDERDGGIYQVLYEANYEFLANIIAGEVLQ